MQKNKVLCTYITFKLWQQTGCQLSIWQNSEAAAGNNIYKALFPNSFLTQKCICKYLIETMNKITRNAADNYLQTFYLCSVTHTHYIVVSYSNWYFFINKLFYTFHTYFCPFLQFLHILFYFTTFLFFYIIIAPRKTFSYPWWCHSHIDWKKIRFSFLFKQLNVSHVQCLVSNILLKDNMNRSSNILILSSHIKHWRLHAFTCNTYNVLLHVFCYITQITI